MVDIIAQGIGIVGMVVFTFGFYLKDAKTGRKLALINSPCWLTYDIISMSIGGIICEVINLFSIVIGIIRHDVRKNSKQNEGTALTCDSSFCIVPRLATTDGWNTKQKRMLFASFLCHWIDT